MKPIVGISREEVWIKAIHHLLCEAPDHLDYNVILEIQRPLGGSDPESKALSEKVDGLLAASGLSSLHTVAETIFPFAEYKKFGKDGVFVNYPNEIFPVIQSCDGNSRGTYALRILRGKDPKGKDCNPLESVLNRLRGQLARNGVRCAFELSLEDVGVESIPINRNDSSLLGFPCLSHLSFKLNHDRSAIHLTALYRSHDYVQKALGNLLGLSRLQFFVARELGISVGNLVCHSTLARLDRHKRLGKRKIEALVSSEPAVSLLARDDS